MTGIYVDSSALLKRVFVEPESPQVRSILRARNEQGDLIAASELAWVEIARALLRAGVDDVEAQLSSACSGVARQPLDSTILSRARATGPAMLRSLDAIHLSAAVNLGATEMLAFDERLRGAAEAIGIRAIP